MSTVRLFRQTGLQLDAQLGQAIFDSGSRYLQVKFHSEFGLADQTESTPTAGQVRAESITMVS